MSTRDLIDAIASGDSLATQQAFESEMVSRIAERMDAMRQEVAQNMFKEHAEDLGEGADLKKLKRSYNQAAKDANMDQVGAGKKIDNTKKGLRQKDVAKTMGEELTLEDFTLEELEDFMMSEDFDQLDEESKQALSDYIKSATE